MGRDTITFEVLTMYILYYIDNRHFIDRKIKLIYKILY